MNHLKYKLMRDSRMPSDRLRAALPGVPPNLGPDQVHRLVVPAPYRKPSCEGGGWWLMQTIVFLWSPSVAGYCAR